MNKKNTKYLTIALIVIIIIMGLAFPFFLAKSRLASAVSELRKEGFPVTPQEFADKYYKPIPEEQNAATTLKTAISLLKTPEDDEFLIIRGFVKIPRLDQKLAPELLDTAKKDIQNNIDFFNEMEKVHKYDLIHFDYNWKAGFNMMLSETNNFRKAVRAYSLKTELAINNNDSQQVSELLHKMFYISKLVSQEPTFLGQLVFHACESMTTIKLERCMNMISFSSAELKSFANTFDKQEQLIIKQWPKMWLKELTFLLTFINFNKFDSSLFSKTAIDEGFPLIIFYYYAGKIHNDLVDEIKLIKRLLKIPLDIYAKRKLKLEKIEEESKKLTSIEIVSPTNSFQGIYRKALEIITRLRCAKTACAVQRFRLKYGKLPEKLSQLVPEFLVKVPIDPFDGKDLRYFHGNFDVKYEVPLIPKERLKKDEGDMFGNAFEISYKPVVAKKKGFYIYSVGNNLIDDKGDLLIIYNHKKKDITFTVIDKE